MARIYKLFPNYWLYSLGFTYCNCKVCGSNTPSHKRLHNWPLYFKVSDDDGVNNASKQQPAVVADLLPDDKSISRESSPVTFSTDKNLSKVAGGFVGLIPEMWHLCSEIGELCHNTLHYLVS